MVLTLGIEPSSTAWKAVIIPLDQVSKVVTKAGLEPATVRLEVEYSVQLSYKVTQHTL